MNGKIENLISEIEDLEKNEVEILELKSTRTKSRNSLNRMTEKAVSQPEDGSLEIINLKNRKEQKILYTQLLYTNTVYGVFGIVSEREERVWCRKKIFEEVMAENFPTLVRDISLQI